MKDDIKLLGLQYEWAIFRDNYVEVLHSLGKRLILA